MRRIGFSTGALAYSDFRRARAILVRKGIYIVELSALRMSEMRPLIDALDALDMTAFDYVAVHAPSEFPDGEEQRVAECLETVRQKGWSLIVHAEAIRDYALWRSFGDSLCVENADKRKRTGRTARELSRIFQQLPAASFCFDIGHARQVDPTMTEAYLMLRDLGSRLRQVHVSEVSADSRHDVISLGSIFAFRRVAHLIPAHVPLILETPVDEEGIERQVNAAAEALPTSGGQPAVPLRDLAPMPLTW
jgi:sugar phosphate isomerase/epimerase